MDKDLPTTEEIRRIIAESAAAQLSVIADVLQAANIDVASLSRAIAGGSSMLIGLRIGSE